jgi:hypothetical protein
MAVALAAELDWKLAGAEPLHDVADWYSRAHLDRLGFDEICSTDNEAAALNLSFEDFQSEAEILTRPCGCIRPDPNVCKCYVTLKAARAASGHASIPDPVGGIPNLDLVVKTIEEVERALVGQAREALHARGMIPRKHIGLWPAMLFLAPLGNELAQDTLALALRDRPDHDEASVIKFKDQRYVILLYEASTCIRTMPVTRK